MALTDIQLDLIFHYFEGGLSAGEEAQLMQQLQQDNDMQQAFDQEVLLRHFEPEETEDLSAIMQKPQTLNLFALSSGPVLEPADDFLQRVAGALKEEVVPAKKPVEVLKIKRNGRWLAAAAVFFCVLAAVLYFQFKHKKVVAPIVKIHRIDTGTIVQHQQWAPLKDTVRPVIPEENLVPLYAYYNRNPFSGELLADMIPPEASDYQDMYNQKKYEELATLSKNQLGSKGQSNPAKQKRAESYFYFYKALANLQTGKTNTAEKLLKELLNSSAGISELQNPVRWYLLMGYLKMNNKMAALAMADFLTKDKKNSYFKQASEIKEKLNH